LKFGFDFYKNRKKFNLLWKILIAISFF
jgi:hypothetical protein